MCVCVCVEQTWKEKQVKQEKSKWKVMVELNVFL